MDRVDNNQYKATADNELYKFYIDYPPSYNEYGKQLIERDLDAALSSIFRSMYGARTLIPEVPGLFIDIERYTHILSTLDNRMELNAIVNETIGRICGDLRPEVSVSYDEANRSLTYDIKMEGEFLLKVEAADTYDSATVTMMNKRFYE